LPMRPTQVRCSRWQGSFLAASRLPGRWVFP